MISSFPWRRINLQFSQMRLTLDRTFMANLAGLPEIPKIQETAIVIKPRRITREISSYKASQGRQDMLSPASQSLGRGYPPPPFQGCEIRRALSQPWKGGGM